MDTLSMYVIGHKPFELPKRMDFLWILTGISSVTKTRITVN